MAKLTDITEKKCFIAYKSLVVLALGFTCVVLVFRLSKILCARAYIVLIHSSNPLLLMVVWNMQADNDNNNNIANLRKLLRRQMDKAETFFNL